MFADRVKELSASGIRKVFDLASKMKNPVNFSIGQADFDVPDVIKEATIKAIKAGQNRYTVTQGIEPLRNRVREHLQKTRNIDPQHLFITSGTSGGLLTAFMVLINPEDEVLLPDPYFVMYKHLVNLASGKPVYYDLYPDFQFNVDEIEKKITDKTKIILLNSPSNPTGAIFRKEDIEKLAKLAKKYDLYIISDEIYETFIYEQEHHSVATYYPEKTVVLGGFSKTYGMPGWRMGFAAGPYQLIDKMITLQQFSFVCAPTPAQYGCIEAFDVDMTPYIEEYREKRDLIYNGLIDLGYKVKKPGGSFYIFPEVPWGKDTEFCEAAIKKELLIIPGSAFSNHSTHFRISYAVSNDDIKRGLNILEELIK